MNHLSKKTWRLPDTGMRLPFPTSNILMYLYWQRETITYNLSTLTTTLTYDYDSTCCTFSNTTDATTNYAYDPGNSSINTGKSSSFYNYDDICDLHQSESRSKDNATYAEVQVHYYGYRYYNPELGRWVSRDPVGDSAFLKLLVSRKLRPRDMLEILQEQFSPWYLFVDNEPIAYVDKNGLFKGTELCCMILAAGPLSIPRIDGIRDVATELAHDLYGDEGEGVENAMRHCIGACMLTKTFGREDAHEILECHEEHGDSSTGGQGDRDTIADRHNNEIGQDIAETENASCIFDCYEALQDGELDTKDD